MFFGEDVFIAIGSILLITGFAGEDLDQALPQLLKPFRQEDLAEAMERLLSAS